VTHLQGKQLVSVIPAMRIMSSLSGIVCMLTFILPMAVAQDGEGSSVSQLKRTTCVSRTSAPTSDVHVKIDAAAGDSAICLPGRDAATALLNDPLAGSRAVVAEVLAEAERRAANLRFEVGAPPPRFTQDRIQGH
jgi:hypothetical protein